MSDSAIQAGSAARPSLLPGLSKALLFALILLLPFFSGSTHYLGLALSGTLLLALAVLALIQHWMSGRDSIRVSRFEIAGIAVLLAAALSSLWAPYAIDAWKMVGGLLLIGIGYRVARSLARDGGLERLAVIALIASGVLQALFALHQYFFSGWYARDLPGYFSEYIQPSIRGGIVRAVGGFIDPNNLAAYLNVCFAVTLALILFAGIGVLARAGLVVATIIFLTGILLSGSKAGLIVTALIATALLMLRDKRLLIVIALLVAAMLIVPNAVRDQFFDTIANDPYFGIRFDIWGASLTMAAEHPLTGVGSGNYPFVAQRYAPPTEQLLVRHSHVPSKAHNSYLHALDEWGIVGFLPLLVMAYFASMVLVAASRQSVVREEGGPLRLGFAAAIAGLMVHSLVHNTLHNRCLLTTGLVLMAVLAARYSREGDLTFSPFVRRYPLAFGIPANFVTVAAATILVAGFGFAQIIHPLNYETAMAGFNARLGNIFSELRVLDSSSKTSEAEYGKRIDASRVLAAEMESLRQTYPANVALQRRLGTTYREIFRRTGEISAYSQAMLRFANAEENLPGTGVDAFYQFDTCTDLLRYGYPRTPELVEKMETLAERMIEQWPNRASFHLLAAGIAAERGPDAWPRIKSLLRKAIELEPNFLQAISELERMARLAGDDDLARQAARLYDEAVERIEAGPPPAQDDNYARQILRPPARR